MKIDQKYIWDYDIKSLDLKNPEVLKWYLSRKINFGDWRSLDSKIIRGRFSHGFAIRNFSKSLI